MGCGANQRRDKRKYRTHLEGDAKYGDEPPPLPSPKIVLSDKLPGMEECVREETQTTTLALGLDNFNIGCQHGSPSSQLL